MQPTHSSDLPETSETNSSDELSSGEFGRKEDGDQTRQFRDLFKTILEASRGYLGQGLRRRRSSEGSQPCAASQEGLRKPGLSKKPPKTKPTALQIGQEEYCIAGQPILVKSKVLSNRQSHERKSQKSTEGTTTSLLDSDSSLSSSSSDSSLAFSSCESASKGEISDNSAKSKVQRQKQKNSHIRKRKDEDILKTIRILRNWNLRF